MFFPEVLGLLSASLEGFDTEKGFTEQHSSSRCKVARVTSLRVPRRASNAQNEADGCVFRRTIPEPLRVYTSPLSKEPPSTT